MGKKLANWHSMKRLKEYAMKETKRSRGEKDEKSRCKRPKFYHWILRHRVSWGP